MEEQAIAWFHLRVDERQAFFRFSYAREVGANLLPFQQSMI
jgi:hypothetical protein